VNAYDALPSLHIPTLWLAGGISGTLWSIGNFFSILSVEHLGEGVGYSVVQAAMLVSGLWGIFYFREITDTMAIMKWFVSAGLTVSGILLLSYEHHEVQ
jgi:glucose uptake protein GlcU